jgi:carbon-monoxide dehydrogenase small subunit
LALQANRQQIVTVKGIGTPERPHPLQVSFVEQGAIQCGYCTPGMIVSAKALLDENPHPSREEIRRALSGNLCRCTGYKKIIQAVERAAEKLK